MTTVDYARHFLYPAGVIITRCVSGRAMYMSRFARLIYKHLAFGQPFQFTAQLRCKAAPSDLRGQVTVLLEFRHLCYVPPFLLSGRTNGPWEFLLLLTCGNPIQHSHFLATHMGVPRLEYESYD